MTAAVWVTAALAVLIVAGMVVLFLAARADVRNARDWQQSARDAARDRHPSGREVFDRAAEPRQAVIPPSAEVRDHAQGRSVAEAAAADPIRIQLDATWNMPAAQERRTP